MTLREYMTKNNLRQVDIARRLEIGQGHVSHLLNDRGPPSADLMRRIYWATEGAVTPNDMFLLPPRSREAAE
jgi:transcriptional regulator with XRE-family HTH domain